MTIILGAIPVCEGQLNILDEVTDNETPLGSLHRNDFRDACLTDGRRHGGWVHPSRVSAILHEWFGEYSPQWFSGQWAPACGPNGFMDKTDILRPIDPTRSLGNGNKMVPLRKLRVAS